jgi:6-pyruvoyltetrahydropterin/6-carboxytetrahydropterin synthase
MEGLNLADCFAINTVVNVTISFCAGHRLLNYDGPCANLHGHNYEAIIYCTGPIKDNGFVADFSEVKKAYKTWIDDNWDHGMILNENDPYIEPIRADKMKVFAMASNPTAENMALHLLSIREAILPGKLITAISIRETNNNLATVQVVNMEPKL